MEDNALLHGSREQELRDILDLAKRLCGIEHPETLNALAELADCLHGNGDNEDAQAAYLELIELLNKVHGPDFPPPDHAYAKPFETRWRS